MVVGERAIRAIVFDFGGVFTLSDVSQARLRTYDKMLGLAPDTLQNILFTGEAWEMASTGQLAHDGFWERTGRPFERDLPDEFKRFRQGMFWAEPINEDMVALAQRLHRHYPLAICSNALPELTEILAARPELQALFDVEVISALAGLRKPDPAIFYLTAQRLGLPLAACLLVDDKPRNTQAAEALGMPAVVFQSVPQLANDLVELGVMPPAEASSTITNAGGRLPEARTPEFFDNPDAGC